MFPASIIIANFIIYCWLQPSLYRTKGDRPECH